MEKTLPPEIADALLARLAEDDRFRDVFRRSPREALAELGYAPAREPATAKEMEDGPWACLHGSGLPDKEQVAQLRETLKSEMTCAMSHQIFHVKAK